VVASAAAQMSQTTPHTANGANTQAQHKAQNAAESNPACQKIIQECKNLGYIVGEWKKDNGLWKDCFDPVVKGGTPTRDGKAINVPVSQSEVQSCRTAVEHHNNNKAAHSPSTAPNM
jgi:hypothetical protein